MSWLLVCFALLSGPPAVAAKANAADIEARHWFHNPAYRLHDDRTVVLFFFTSDRETARWARRLEVVGQRPDAVVIGLTRDSKESVEEFIKRYRVRFTVGSGSRSAEAFGVRELPAVRLFRRGKDGIQEEKLDYGGLNALLENWPQSEDEASSELSARMGAEGADCERRSRPQARRRGAEAVRLDRSGGLPRVR